MTLAPDDFLDAQPLMGCTKPSPSSGVGGGQAPVCEAAYHVRRTLYTVSIFDEASDPTVRLAG